MACNELEELEKDCNNNLGGATQLIYNDQDQVGLVTVDPVTDKITAIEHLSAFKGIYFKRNVGMYNEEEKRDLNEGTNFVTNTLTVGLKRREAAKSKMLRIAGEGQRDLAMLMKDGNGIWWYFEKMQLATNTGGSGENKAAGSKYDVTFTGEYEFLAKEVLPSVIALLLAEPA